jgi:HlyD family secretion protein
MKNKVFFIVKKYWLYAAVGILVLGGGYFLFLREKTPEKTLTVHVADFVQQVAASGKIVANQNLDLSFEQAGTVRNVHVKVGDHVVSGQLLANENTSQLDAQLAEMEAGISLQQAKLNQLLAGASVEDIQTAKDQVVSAQQDVNNAYATGSAALSSNYTTMTAANAVVFSVRKTYFNLPNDQQSILVQQSETTIDASLTDVKKYLDVAQASLNINNIDMALIHAITAANLVYENTVIIRQQCDQGYYYSAVSATDKASLDTQKTNINTAINSLTSARSGIASFTIALTKAKDVLAAKQAPARSPDIAVYQAQIEQAKAQASSIVSQLKKQKIYSPIAGVVTAVNAKAGMVSNPNDVAISVMSSNNFQIESYVPEINIALVKIGNPAQVILDAYGNDHPFDAKVASIDPSETIKDGVSTYKVTLELVKGDDQIKSGMTGTVTITTEKKSNVISIPQGIVTILNGQKAVKVKSGKDTANRIIETGLVSSLGNVEVTSGLSDGDVVVLPQ